MPWPWDSEKVCWEVYHREYHSVLQKLALVNEHSTEFIEQLFAICTQLGKYISCEISPFLMEQFITWWIEESETNHDKHFQLIEQWYQSADGQCATIDFIELLDLLYKLFFRPFPSITRHFLLKDALSQLGVQGPEEGVPGQVRAQQQQVPDQVDDPLPGAHGVLQAEIRGGHVKNGVIFLGERTSVMNLLRICAFGDYTGEMH